MIFRKLCEAYFKTPLELEDLTLDQLSIMAVDIGLLGRGKRVTGTPQELYAMGLLKTQPYPGGMSYVQRLKMKKEAASDKASKRQRRTERRARLIAQKGKAES